MDGVQTAAEAPPAPGLLESLKLYLLGWVDLLKTRVEILSTELEEEKERLKQIVLLAVGALVFLGFGMLALTTFAVVLLWEYRLWVLGMFAVLYFGCGLLCAWVAKKQLRTKPKLFSTTLAELAKDHQHLST